MNWVNKFEIKQKEILVVVEEIHKRKRNKKRKNKTEKKETRQMNYNERIAENPIENGGT